MGQTWAAPPLGQTWGNPPLGQTWGNPPLGQTWGNPLGSDLQLGWKVFCFFMSPSTYLVTFKQHELDEE